MEPGSLFAGLSRKIPLLVSTRPYVFRPRRCSRRAIRPRHMLSTLQYFYTPLNTLSSLWGRPEGGGFFGKSQWRQQTSRCAQICPQRDVKVTRRALEAEVQGEVDRARRSAGGGVPPAPSLATPPTSSRATLSPLRLSSADNNDEDESASGGGDQLGPWETARTAEPKPPSCSSIDQGSESL